MLTIGICDDRSLCRQLLQAFIRLYEEETGIIFDIHQFDSGEALLNELNRHALVLDLLFLDNSMKNLTGLETAQRIRQSDSMPTCGIVFVTADDEHEQFMTAQPLHVISKPATRECINTILDKVLAERGHCDRIL
ncbi:LytR/AlgR family response regulator transcription factor [Desulfitobacterium chlororespirans]|uniref:Stage 0 sporulation protein A homolog n=1 Tax=Desulfitobacterium chlororespirans DSM 11544 TaxID=1121395 RepID=A0A1M7S0S1_9FIRM|nr:response regulator [Desulfitobacterium chlororespirans]SHN52030.1 Response regulator receiver domain-containing protein [Desulfitobacterium chlororespirans DSM 11544]